MGKYDPLNGHLRRQRSADFELTFAEMERVIGAMLPRSAEHPQWWQKYRKKEASIQQKGLREAGFDAFLVAGKDRVRFKRRLSS